MRISQSWFWPLLGISIVVANVTGKEWLEWVVSSIVIILAISEVASEGLLYQKKMQESEENIKSIKKRIESIKQFIKE
ncbi:MAG: hypothetical protein RIE73_03885 [Coleofasciculus sp. C1-SOL-03]|uniref:hypothetical protein n=1 Tax=Coleofasciculus sp. C1-SOL-03 TaxID=3069522 RepID=UPI003302293F